WRPLTWPRSRKCWRLRSGRRCSTSDLQPTRGRVGPQLLDHVVRRRRDRVLPLRGIEAITVLLPRVGKDDSTRVVDHPAESTLVEGCCAIASRSPLSAKARNEEPRAGHNGP